MSTRGPDMWKEAIGDLLRCCHPAHPSTPKTHSHVHAHKSCALGRFQHLVHYVLEYLTNEQIAVQATKYTRKIKTV